MTKIQELLQCAEKLQDWIVESEMRLSLVRDEDGQYNEKELDKTDSFYPAFKQPGYVADKLEEENELGS